VGSHSPLGQRRQASIYSTFNARAEEFTTKPAFRDAWTRGQRYLVVTDGFYEWKKLDAKGKLKQPHAIAMAGDSQMVMAGLWAKWKSPTSGEEVLSCTILTCEPNNVMGELHDRMPVILAESAAVCRDGGLVSSVHN
jgi:putative SOS response-associated peptidase YedK